MAQASELSFPVVFHTENCAVHSGNPTVSSVYLPTPQWHRVGEQRVERCRSIKNAPPAALQRLHQRLLVQLYAPDDGRGYAQNMWRHT